jgi:hypothetical protein
MAGPVQRVHIMIELNVDNLKKVVKDILDEWSGICHLYNIVHDFAEMYTGRNAWQDKRIMVKNGKMKGP